MSDTPEARALLSALDADWERYDAWRTRPGFRPMRLAELADSCDVAPQLHHQMEQAGRLEDLGDPAASALQQARHKCRMDNVLLLARVEEALDLLAAVGVRPVVLKGLDVVHRFGVPFDARTMDDADFLLEPAEFPRAVEALERAGWSPPEPESRRHWLRSSFELPIYSPGPVPVMVELHWDLLQERRYTVDVEGLFRRAVPLEVAGRECRALDPHDAVAHLLIHHVQHYFDRRLKWVVDALRYAGTPGFEWGRVFGTLRHWRGEAAGLLALRHLRKLYPHRFPPVPARGRRRLAWRMLLAAPLRSPHTLDLFRGTRSRLVQLYLAVLAYENPARLPAYGLHWLRRDRRPGRWSDSAERPAAEGGGPAGGGT